MIPIISAEEYVCNTPVKKAGIVHGFLKFTDPDMSEQDAKKKKEEEEVLKQLQKLFLLE